MNSFHFELAYALNPWYDPHTMTNDAFQQGYQAFLEGQEIDTNPFQDNTDEYLDWESGWVTAADEANAE